MRRMILMLAVAALVAAMVAASALPSLADPPLGAGCKGLVNAAQKSGNPQVVENAIEHGCIKDDKGK